MNTSIIMVFRPSRMAHSEAVSLRHHPLWLSFKPEDFSGPGGGPGPLGAAPDGDPVVFGKNTPFGKTGGTPPDPSGASSGNVVLTTGNTYASLSTDGGSTFTLLDPTTIFPSAPNKDSAGNLLDNRFITNGSVALDRPEKIFNMMPLSTNDAPPVALDIR